MFIIQITIQNKTISFRTVKMLLLGVIPGDSEILN